MSQRIAFGLCLTLCVVVVPGIRAADADGLRDAAAAVVHAGQASGSIHIDGVLEEPDWSHAGVIADLTQQDPHPGEATPFRTEIRVLIEHNVLYFGLACSDPEPDRISAHTMQRDGDLSGDDRGPLGREGRAGARGAAGRLLRFLPGGSGGESWRWREQTGLTH